MRFVVAMHHSLDDDACSFAEILEVAKSRLPALPSANSIQEFESASDWMIEQNIDHSLVGFSHDMETLSGAMRTRFAIAAIEITDPTMISTFRLRWGDDFKFAF